MTNSLLQTALLRAQAKRKNKKNGFTLIELMVVVAILGVLMAVGLPELTKAMNKGKAAAATSTLTNAAKECSLSLILNNDGTDYTAANFTAGDNTVTGDCAFAADGTAPTLTLVGEDGENYRSVFDGTIPGTVEVYTPA
jgi:prepilin-type N-terminal cleavage/methylation domain-containing protein